MPDPRDALRISSRQNKRLRPVRRAKDNREPDFLFLEGRKLAEEWLGTGLAPEMAVVADAFLKQPGAGELLERLSSARQGVVRVPDRLMEELSSVQTPPGLIVLAPRKVRLLQGLPDGCSFALVLHGIQDPGNLGSLLRTAEAAGVEAVVVTANSADALGPKALRGSMGAALRLRLWLGPAFGEAADACRARGIRVFAASPRGHCSLWEQDWAVPCAVVLGSESPGLSPAELAQADVEINVPMCGRCESLNVGAAGAVLLYEVARQRGSGGRRF